MSNVKPFRPNYKKLLTITILIIQFNVKVGMVIGNGMCMTKYKKISKSKDGIL